MDSTDNQVEKIIHEYFKDFNITDLDNFINCFCYENPPIKNTEVQIEKFLKDNDMMEAFLTVKQSDIDKSLNNFFYNKAYKERELIQEIKVALLSFHYHKSKMVVKELKTITLDLYDIMNRSESYFYGEEEDAKNVEKIKSI